MVNSDYRLLRFMNVYSKTKPYVYSKTIPYFLDTKRN